MICTSLSQNAFSLLAYLTGVNTELALLSHSLILVIAPLALIPNTLVLLESETFMYIAVLLGLVTLLVKF